MPNLKPTETWFAFSQVLVNLPFLEDHKKRGGETVNIVSKICYVNVFSIVVYFV